MILVFNDTFSDLYRSMTRMVMATLDQMSSSMLLKI